MSGMQRDREKLGVCWADEWLEHYAEHLVGVNLHDLQDLKAYHPPGTGDLEWDENFQAVAFRDIKSVRNSSLRNGTGYRGTGIVRILSTIT